ncbi:substrate-binding domain-containing protein [Lachnospiraceae bacterium 64-25]|nr:D-threitol-binding protein [Lachnospiraceae bacterium]
MKKLLAAMVVGATVAMFAGCGQKAEETPAPAETTAQETVEAPSEAAQEETKEEETTEGMTFGYLICNERTAFMLDLIQGTQDKCDELGIKLIVNDSDMDPAKQISQAESMISQQVDAIIVTAADAEACVPIIEKCNAANIPVVGVCNTFSGDLQPDGFVGSNDNQSAELAVSALCEALGGEGKIGMISGVAGQSSEVIRGEATKRLLSEKYPDVELVVEDTGSWTRDGAMTLTENWIQKYGEEGLDAIFCQNDEMAIGTCNALENAGLTGKILVSGIDLIPESKEYLESGKMYADVFQDGYGQGFKAVEVAFGLVNGEDVGGETWIPFELVTKENMADYFE